MLEVAFTCGTLREERQPLQPDGLRRDLTFMRDLRKLIEEKQIPAHAPIEQRWTSGSSSLMSPAFGDKDSLHSWVGIIMYLPTYDENMRDAITNSFTKYGERMRDAFADEYSLKTHWAKIEIEIKNERRKKKKE